jgi:hypothetical protein
MTGFSVASEGSDRLRIIAGILERSNRALRLRSLGDEELVETARAVDEIIERIPTLRLDDAYHEVMRNRQVKGALQPQELLEAWYRLRGDERAISAPSQIPKGAFAPEPRCRYCDDTGWQPVDQPERGIYRYSVRACVCDAAPASERKQEPLAEPYWEKPPSGRWRRI